MDKPCTVARAIAFLSCSNTHCSIRLGLRSKAPADTVGWKDRADYLRHGWKVPVHSLHNLATEIADEVNPAWKITLVLRCHRPSDANAPSRGRPKALSPV